MYDPRVSMQQVRKNCLECAGDTPKFVAYCSCDGIHSTWCRFWPYRFGIGPKKVVRKYGEQFITPELMPDADIPLEDLPPIAQYVPIEEMNT